MPPPLISCSPKTGIGLETVALLASKGCTVYLAGRGDLTPAITTLKSRPGLTNATLLPLPLDLSTSATSLAGAGAFPKDSRLDILIANAGISLDMRTEPSAEGWEHHFQTNQIGHFAFITALLPVVERSANEHGEARIVLLGSEAWKFATRPIDYDALRKELPKSALGLVGGMKRYGTSKFAEMIFAHELARRLAARGVENVYVNSVHPGKPSSPSLQMSSNLRGRSGGEYKPWGNGRAARDSQVYWEYD